MSMRTMRRVVCTVRGHVWETTEDPYGRVTTCTRCGALHHTHSSGPPGLDKVFEKGGLGTGTGE